MSYPPNTGHPPRLPASTSGTVLARLSESWVATNFPRRILVSATGGRISEPAVNAFLGIALGTAGGMAYGAARPMEWQWALSLLASGVVAWASAYPAREFLQVVARRRERPLWGLGLSLLVGGAAASVLASTNVGRLQLVPSGAAGVITTFLAAATTVALETKAKELKSARDHHQLEIRTHLPLAALQTQKRQPEDSWHFRRDS